MNTATDTVDETLAIVFPGQGSQSPGMLSELAENESLIKETFAQASDVLGYDLWQLCQDGPEEELNRTDKTQPAMLAAGVAVWRAWRHAGGAAPGVMAGHSLGEYTALVCAGAIEFTDAVSLVEQRGRCMQSAVPAGVGAMAAILGLDDATVTDVCERAAAGEVVSPVNFNSPGQVVIAGNTDAVQRAMVLAKEAGAKRALPLAVSVPSHCSLMQPAAEQFAARLAQTVINTTSIAVLQNVDAKPHDQPDVIRDNLKKQLYCPVQWVASVQNLGARGVTRIVEAGPGKVLAGLCKRIDKSIANAAVYDPASLAAALDN
ncbi:MAG: ACP S-malonyltransferase [Gammaproteobacteria bacterium]|nr:ACP S-malonyltransferase [Gammaproteobacteria bacterium]MDH3935651.1 ACP S-malonyltransferase [Gammaproteobacteria bacterium]MDH3985419.1 ACP S-malonyltransferase [Gammaproteobacteria bacterium]